MLSVSDRKNRLKALAGVSEVAKCRRFLLKFHLSSQKIDVHPSFVDRSINSGVKFSQILKKTRELYLGIVDKTVIGGCMSVKNVSKKSFTGIDKNCVKCYGGGYFVKQ